MTATPCPLVTAISKVQGQLTTIPKNRTVTVRTKDGREYTFNYADLEAITTAIRPLLAAEGLSVIQSGVWDEDANAWALETLIMHPGTDRMIRGRTPILWGQNDPKAFGSGQTYARRYGLCALLGIVSDDDDDGEQARRSPKQDTETRDQARREANASRGGSQAQGAEERPQKPGGGLEEALRSAQGSGFDTAGFMLAQAQEHGLMADNGKPRRDLFEVVTADQAAAMLKALGQARTEALKGDVE